MFNADAGQDPNDLRLEITRQAVAHFARDPRLKAALLTGSAAVRFADENSDIDCILFFDGPFTQADIDAARLEAEATGGGLHYGDLEQGFAVYHFIRGVKCDFGFELIPVYERLISTMLEHPHLEHDPHIILSGVQKGIPLYGEPMLREWQTRLEAYPDALPVMLVEKHLKFMPRWAIEKMGLERGEPLFVAECLLQAVESIVGVLCGLNRQYHPGKLKGVAWPLSQMPIAPPDIRKRLEHLFLVDQRTAVEELAGLVDELFALVEAHLPQVDTTKARARWAIVLRR